MWGFPAIWPHRQTYCLVAKPRLSLDSDRTNLDCDIDLSGSVQSTNNQDLSVSANLVTCCQQSTYAAPRRVST